MNKSRIKNIINGIILILVAIAIVMYQMNLFTFSIGPDISLWQMIIGVVLVYLLIQSLFKINYGGILFSLAFIGIVFGTQLHIEALVPWTLLFVALIGTIALELIFGKHHGRRQSFSYDHANSGNTAHWGSDSVVAETIENDIVNESVSFTGATKYIHSDNFVRAELDCSFCGAEFYFDKVNIPSGNAEICINSRFCGVTLFVPKNWTIINDISTTLAATEVDYKDIEAPVATVRLCGSNSFAAIEVKRV